MNKVVVIGGGASGLVAAIIAARRGASVSILERNSSCGKKILVTGNGKCNYYNCAQDVKHYHSSSMEFIDDIINDVNNRLVLDFFDSIGVVPKIKNGYYYPYSNQAVSVLNAIMDEIKLLKVNVINNVFVKDIVYNKDSFLIRTDDKDYCADKVIIATGSYAFYKNMEINSYDMITRLGHNIVKPLPALVQLRINNKICKKWAGVRCGVNIKLYQNKEYVREEDGEILLTSYGISGICAMQLSGNISRGLDNNCLEEVVINFVPNLASDVESFIDFVEKYNNKVSKRTIIQMLDNILNYKLGNVILEKVHISGNSYWDSLSNEDKIRLASNIVSFRMAIDGTNSYKDAQVCSGGVAISEINTKTMESLRIKNLYMVGELLDVDGDCGGYNLTFAWISGILAGIACSKERDYD